jgi:hypothetical protein
MDIVQKLLNAKFAKANQPLIEDAAGEILRLREVIVDDYVELANFCSQTDAELRLQMGELSAQELRAVRAVLDVIKGML